MLSDLPGLRDFQPRFYTGGPTRFYLPLFHDLVVNRKPKTIVARGFGDGQAFFAVCQAVREHGIECKCVALRRERAGEQEGDDDAWIRGKDYGDEFYGDFAHFRNGSDAVNEFDQRNIDLLLLDDCDTGSELRADLSIWGSKVSTQGVLLFHGLAVERSDDPQAVWDEWRTGHPSAELRDGIGLSIALQSEAGRMDDFLSQQLFAGSQSLAELAELCRMAAERIDAQARAARIQRENAALQSRQIWLDSVLADRWKAQEVIDYQMRAISDWQDKFDSLHRDRAKAQEIMDTQAEQLKRLRWDIRDLKQQIKERKKNLKKPKVRRPIPEKIVREIRRLPRNLRRMFRPETKAAPSKQSAAPVVGPVERYASWIRENEPDADRLEDQRRATRSWITRPKISLLLPVHNTLPTFLDEMLASVAGQTYDNWEVCLVDGGSDNSDTLEILKRWEAREPRFHIRHLPQNLGIAENTNRALELATGDFVACVDHDDALTPFALFELAKAIRESPDTQIFYSDEDRCSEEGIRHSPFFKPEWSPELLQSFMYLGHLTAYRRDLVVTVGGFRKEFDLSQDYDLALRATEHTRAIQHIPHVLYHWREHAASGNLGGKPEARKTNLAALRDAMQRRGLNAEVLEYPTANRARMKIANWPRISIIIPTDSASRAEACARVLPQQTDYPALEIVLVTNSAVTAAVSEKISAGPNVRFVAFDQPFNFSAKCNRGARAANGERLIFLNDDVECAQRDWIPNLIEPLENPEIGAVAPKMIYGNGKIQHAGLVMGVRGLIGTAFHQWNSDSADYFNFAQSMRNVSVLSGACLAMRREDFFRVGEFDETNTPISHSDADLCFKIRQNGMRCVYTPFATMIHRGHVSIGDSEHKTKAPPRDKSSIFLLKRWADFTCHDPYYTDNMRDWLYADSPTPIRMFAPESSPARMSSRDLLFISHDLTWSGAPIILLHAAKWCWEHGVFVIVMSPEDGPLREKFTEAGIPVVVDPLVASGHKSFTNFAQNFDCLVANTIFGAAAISAAQRQAIPHVWWIHEGLVGEHYLHRDAKLRATVKLADFIVTPDRHSSLIYQPLASRPIRQLLYGIPDLARKFGPSPLKTEPLRFLLLGTIEHRKGQEIFLEALRNLPKNVFEKAHFQIVGRPNDLKITGQINAAAAACSSLTVRSYVTHDEALALIHDADVMISVSWDETGPITLIEGMALGKAVLSTSVGAVGEKLVPGEDALLFKPGDAESLATAIQRLVREPELVEKLGRNSRKAYERYFTLDRFGADFFRLIEEAISSAQEESKTTTVAPVHRGEAVGARR